MPVRCLTVRPLDAVQSSGDGFLMSLLLGPQGIQVFAVFRQVLEVLVVCQSKRLQIIVVLVEVLAAGFVRAVEAVDEGRMLRGQLLLIPREITMRPLELLQDAPELFHTRKAVVHQFKLRCMLGQAISVLIGMEAENLLKIIDSLLQRGVMASYGILVIVEELGAFRQGGGMLVMRSLQCIHLLRMLVRRVPDL